MVPPSTESSGAAAHTFIYLTVDGAYTEGVLGKQ